MNKQIRRKLEMAERVHEFSRAHPSDEPGYVTLVARLEERLAHAQAVAGRQLTGLAAARGARVRREGLRKVLHSQLLRYLVAVGNVAARSHPGLEARFKLPPHKGSNQDFLTSVKVLLAAAESERELLVSEGMSTRLLEDVRRMVDEFEAVSESVRTGRRNHIGASAELDVIADQVLNQVRVLDGFNRYRFGKEPELLVAWNAVRHVQTAGRSAARPDSDAAPGTPGSIAPAA
jgi:hypothetical protein